MKTTAHIIIALLVATGCTDSTTEGFDQILGADGERPHFDAPADGSATFVPQCPGVPIEIPVPFLGFTSLAGGTFTRIGLAAPHEPINVQLTVEQTEQGAVLGHATGLFASDAGLPAFEAVKYGAGESLILGPVMAFDLDGDLDQPESNGFEAFFAVIGMKTPFARISRLCMVSLEEGAVPFMMTRVGL